MPIEAEVKARVREVEHVHTRLAAWATPQVAVYSDTYFDRAGELTQADRELRIRKIHTDGTTTTLLTYKGTVVDAATGSKTERETTAADPEALQEILTALGYEIFVAFDKHCTNYRFERHSRPLLATVVTVPQIKGTFIEVETLVDDADDLPHALATIREVLRELGVNPGDETRDTYTGAVLAASRTRRSS